MPKKVAAILFFFAWLLCGCGVETMLDSPASGAITLVALIVVIACANVLTRNDDKQNRRHREVPVPTDATKHITHFHFTIGG